MKWESEEGQKVLAVAYALQTNCSNAAITPKVLIKQLVNGWVYGRYSYEKGGWEYSLQQFGGKEQEKPVKSVRIVSRGRKPIDFEKVAKIRFMRLEGHTVREIASELKVGRGTVEKYMK